MIKIQTCRGKGAVSISWSPDQTDAGLKSLDAKACAPYHHVRFPQQYSDTQSNPCSAPTLEPSKCTFITASPSCIASNPAAVPMFDGFWSLANTPQLIGLTSLPKRGATRCSGAAWWVTQDRNGARASTPPPPSPPITIHPAHPLQPSHRRQLPLGNKMRPPRTPVPTPLLNPMIPRGTHARPLELLLPLQLLPATPLFLDQALDDRVSCG